MGLCQLHHLRRPPVPTSAVAPDHVIAVHREIDIPFNTLKLKLGGGEGGHNGLRDISKSSAPRTTTLCASPSSS
jgi:hypothetical protein